MASINFKAFRGQVPRVSDRLLQPNQATRATNCKLTSGRLDPLGGLGLELTGVLPTIRTLYRYRHKVKDENAFYWMLFANDVDVVESPLANDEQGRLYYTSDAFEPRMTTHELAIAGATYPNAWYALGIPNPTMAPSVAVTGGVAPTETRAYAFTFVTTLGEESGPSPASTIVTGNATGAWALTNLQTAPPNNGAITAAAVNTPTTGYVRLTLNTTFGLAPHEGITIAGVAGMTDLNGTHRIHAVNGNQIDLILTTAQTYTSGGTWTRNAPINTTGMVKRIYRSAGTEAQFLYVGEVPVATTTYNDTKPGTELGEVLPTIDTLPPPKNLTCLITLPNGCLVGLAGNELCFSAPYMPYSWPVSNRYSFSGQGVALTPAGNSVIVLTDSCPILFTGSDPEAMSPAVMETYAPCIAKRGVVFVGGGCLYPSYDGLWLAAPGRVENITRKLYREAEWADLTPTTFVSAYHDGQYFGHYKRPTESTGRVWVLDVAEPDGVIEVIETVQALYRNEHDGRLYVTKGDKVYAWDANMSNPYESEWRSAMAQSPRPTNFAVAQVHAEFSTVIPLDVGQIESNAVLMSNADNVGGYLGGDSLLVNEINGSNLIPVIPDTPKKVQFTLYVDGRPFYTRTVISSDPFRLPAGYRSELFQVGINASVPVYSVTIAESVAELAQAST